MIEKSIEEMNRLGYALNIYEYSGKYVSRQPENRWDCTAYDNNGRMSHFGFGPTAQEAVERCLAKSRDIAAGKPVQRRGLLEDDRKKVKGYDPFDDDGAFKKSEDAFE